jgi:surfeit locus 1 family protein
VQRKSWKENLIKQMESKLNLPAEPLPDDLSHLETMEYQTVVMRGCFLHDKEMYLGPRALIKPDGSDTSGGLMSQKNASSGYLIITPFKLEDREETVLINRGWVSRQNVKPETRQQGQTAGNIELKAVVRQPEPRPQFTPDHKTDIFLYRDVPRMSALTGADPIFFDLKLESSAQGGPIGGQTRVTLRNEHLSYIVTWYSLSAFTSYLWWKQVVRRLPF